MTRTGLFVITISLAVAQPAWSATYYVAKPGDGGSDANSCAQAQRLSTPKLTISAGQACLTAAGDQLHIRAGRYDERVSWTTIGASGTEANPIVIRGYEEERPVLEYTGTETCLGIMSWGGRSWITYTNLKIDGSTTSTCSSGLSVVGGSTGVVFRDNEIADAPGSNLFAGDRVTIENNYIHGAGWRAQQLGYLGSNGIYAGTLKNSVIRHNYIFDAQCGGIRVFNSSASNTGDDNVVEFNYVEQCGGGKGLGGASTCGGSGSYVVGDKRNVFRYNVAVNGGARCIWVYPSGAGTADNEIYNNTCVTHPYGIVFDNDTTLLNTLVANNLLVGMTSSAIAGTGSGTSFQTNVATGALTDYTVSTTDYRLKPGTNAARDTGTSVAGALPTVGAPDVGAYEHGRIDSSVVAGGFIEATVNIQTPSVLPAADITGFSVSCVGCAGTPVVSAATLKPGSTNIVRLSITGITTPGSCTLSYDGSTGNLTDSGMIGLSIAGLAPIGLAQGVDTLSAQAVRGICGNSDDDPGGSDDGGSDSSSADTTTGDDAVETDGGDVTEAGNSSEDGAPTGDSTGAASAGGTDGGGCGCVSGRSQAPAWFTIILVAGAGGRRRRCPPVVGDASFIASRSLHHSSRSLHGGQRGLAHRASQVPEFPRAGSPRGTVSGLHRTTACFIDDALHQPLLSSLLVLCSLPAIRQAARRQRTTNSKWTNWHSRKPMARPG